MTGFHVRRPRAVAILVPMLLCMLAGFPGGAAAQDAGGQTAAATTTPVGSMVMVTAASSRSGATSQATAVGVVVDSSGLILVPASVVAPDAPGVAVLYGDPSIPANVAQITVSLGTTISADGPRGRSAGVIAVDGYLDLAIIQVLAASAADVARALHLVAIPLATEMPATGEPVTWATLEAGPIATTTEAAGTAADAITDDRIASGPAWLTTSIPTGDAFPGGALVDADGALLAYPVWSPTSAPLTVSGRPAALVEPLLEAARSRVVYESPHTVAGTGEETLTLTSWVSVEDPCEVDADARGEVSDYPTGTERITSVFAWAGFTDGEDVLTVWYDAAADATDPVLVTTPGQWSGGPDGDCYWIGLGAGDGSALADGAYGVRIMAGGQLRTVADATTTVGGTATDGVTVTGRIVNADTGKGIKGALLVILVKGTDIQEWLDNPSDREIAASATTDKKGYYETAPPITPDEYPFLVYAEGYKIIGGTLDLTTGSFLDDLQLTPSG